MKNKVKKRITHPRITRSEILEKNQKMWYSASYVKYRRSEINIKHRISSSGKMDGSLVNYNEGTPSTKDKDPMILAQSYMMYKIGKLLC